MPNDYFRFKQFTVRQDKCGMKVCTDACIFGASIDAKNHSKILDIGTGTGLLSLIMAQESAHATIDAVEIETSAFEQATTNVYNSHWPERIKTYHASIQDFTEKTTSKYDLIIANPPFYPNHFKSKNPLKKIALHNDALPFGELISCVDMLLAKEGMFWLLLPPRQTLEFEKFSGEEGLFCNKKTFIRPTKNTAANRVISAFSRTRGKTNEKDFIIRDDGNQYSKDFVAHLKNYYLHL